MPDTAEELARLAKRLWPGEREWLVDALPESLNAPATAEPGAAWSSEIERRLAASDHRGNHRARSASPSGRRSDRFGGRYPTLRPCPAQNGARSTFLSILPTAVRGRSGTNCTCLGA